MKAFDYYGVYLFAEDGSGHIGTYCNACLKEAHPEQDIEAENVSPIFAIDEADFYPSCEICDGVFDYINLTEEGQEYERQQEEKNMPKYTVYLASCGYELQPLGGITVHTDSEDMAEITDLAIDQVIDIAPGYFFTEEELAEEPGPHLEPEYPGDHYYSSDHGVWLNTPGAPVVIMPNGERLGGM